MQYNDYELSLYRNQIDKKLPIEYYELFEEGSREELEVINLRRQDCVKEELFDWVSGKREYKIYDLRNLSIKEKDKIIYGIMWRKKHKYNSNNHFWNVYSNTVLSDKITKNMTFEGLGLYLTIQLILWGLGLVALFSFLVYVFTRGVC